MEGKNFIVAQDQETFELLKNAGLQLLNSSYGFYVFANCKKIDFANIDTSKLIFTNNLFFGRI